ncbi:hypothetical protein ACMA1D_01885 [Streptomyces sp. 796.1]|uniref:hypothetical protein n=1 Tax=Streptomyces sp. 796.1 TaxID=3163029 RepID=UPI0039C8EC7C
MRQLPPAARTRLATGDTDGVWGLQEHLQALTVDALLVANWQRANEGLKSSQQSKPPVPLERPGTGRKRQDKNSPERRAKRQAALKRAAERRQAIAAGQIT